MVHPPAVRMSALPASEFAATGPQADRVRQFASSWAAYYGASLDERPCRLVVEQPLPAHAGLGSGTQIALTTGALLHLWRNETLPDVGQLARSVGRGKRSAVGCHGFFHGGIILASGRKGDGFLAPLDVSVNVPRQWRWILWLDPSQQGLAGSAEEEVFQQCSCRRRSSRQSLPELARAIVAAARQADFECFSESLYQYGYSAGMEFASVQGGPFNGALLSRRVELLRKWGILGVGQSSWGPTIFAVVRSETEATEVLQRSRRSPVFANTRPLIAETCSHGFQSEVIGPQCRLESQTEQ